MKNDINIIINSIKHKLFIQNITFVALIFMWHIIVIFSSQTIPYDMWKPITTVIGSVILWMGVALKEYGHDNSIEENEIKKLTSSYFLEKFELKNKLKKIYYTHITISIIILILGFSVVKLINNNYLSIIIRTFAITFSVIILLKKDKRILALINNDNVIN